MFLGSHPAFFVLAALIFLLHLLVLLLLLVQLRLSMFVEVLRYGVFSSVKVQAVSVYTYSTLLVIHAMDSN